ncbi:hypothetical protein FRX31_012653 [Thalictrum thalictroides]|uniref:Uncharacterized protein n=1 Tax=Thalictrum thalictroides TaxID=46969 RepID=A0A7J6WMD1_THATH|nr:hypothetical protein FRX31_012653 [Thalictrum thalictroides]
MLEEKMNLEKLFALSTIKAIVGFFVGAVPQIRNLLIGESVIQDSASLLREEHGRPYSNSNGDSDNVSKTWILKAGSPLQIQGILIGSWSITIILCYLEEKLCYAHERKWGW